MARIAGRAWGVATRRELLHARITPEQIRQRQKRGSLVVVFPGVYRVGHAAPSTKALYMAAVKACGTGSVLAGEAAAHHLGLTRGAPPPPEVAAPTERHINGIKTNRNKIHPTERTTHKRIPCTTPARTLLDLAATLNPPLLSRAVHEAQIRYRTTRRQVEAVLGRHPNYPGIADLRRMVLGETPMALSHLEQAFIQLMQKHDLPLPNTNRETDGHHVDCRWPKHQLTVELDGYRFHNSRHTWEEDRRREREAYARGDQFRRYTYGDVCEDDGRMLSELRPLLGR